MDVSDLPHPPSRHRSSLQPHLTTLIMTSELKACVKLVAEPYLLDLPRFTTPVLGYPAELHSPKEVIPIIVATDGRFHRRFPLDSWVRLVGDMSAGVHSGYLVVLAETLTPTNDPTTVQQIFIFGRVLSIGRLVKNHVTFDTTVAQPDSLRVR